MVHEANKQHLSKDTEGTIVNEKTVQYIAVKTQLLLCGA